MTKPENKFSLSSTTACLTLVLSFPSASLVAFRAALKVVPLPLLAAAIRTIVLPVAVTVDLSISEIWAAQKWTEKTSLEMVSPDYRGIEI